MTLHLAQVTVITDVIARARLVDVRVALRLAGVGGDQLKGFEDRAGVRLAAPNVVNLGDARTPEEFEDESSHVLSMNVVADLLPLVPVDPVLPFFQVARHEVTQKTM